MQYFWDLNNGVVQSTLGLNKVVVQYIWLKQGCGAKLLGLNKDVVQYCWT